MGKGKPSKQSSEQGMLPRIGRVTLIRKYPIQSKKQSF